MLDEEVGRVLDRIEQGGRADTTIVVLFGDHGRPVPRDKQFLYDGGIQVPLIVRWPGHLEPGSVRDELVSSIDRSATALAWAGIDVPSHMRGRVFLGGNKAPDHQYIFAAQDRCDETVDRIRAARDKRYKYIRNYHPDRPYMQLNRYQEVSCPIGCQMQRLEKAGAITVADFLFLARTRPEEELYDTVEDPNERLNLAESEEHPQILMRMAAALKLWMRRTENQGEQPEDPSIAAAWEARMGETYTNPYSVLAEREAPWK